MKCIRRSHLTQSSMENLLTEIKVMKELQHEHIVQLVEFDVRLTQCWPSPQDFSCYCIVCIVPIVRWRYVSVRSKVAMTVITHINQQSQFAHSLECSKKFHLHSGTSTTYFWSWNTAMVGIYQTS